MARTYKRDKNGKFASTGGGGGSGKSLRQTVQSKRSIGSARTTYRNEKADKYAGNPSVKKTANRAKSVNRGNIPGTNARAMNRDSEQRYNKQIASTSGASSRGKSLRQTVQAKRGVESTKQAAMRNTKYGGPKPFADQQTASRSINRSMSKSANTRVASTSVPMSKAASKAFGAKLQKDAATLKANKARRVKK